MTPDTFWKFFLKAFGLYLTWQTLIIIPSFFSALIYVNSTPDKSDWLPTISVTVLIILIFISVLRFCIFKSEWVIEKLSLTKGFADEKIDINIHRSSLLSIAIIVLGGLMLADGLPLLIFNIFDYIQHNSSYDSFSKNRYSPYIISNLVKVIIGYFMIADSRLIINFIERKRKKAVINEESE